MKGKFWSLMSAFTICFGIKTVAQSADLILLNGKIFTSDTSQIFVQALAIKGNKIVSVGSNTAIKKFATGNTKTIDLKGKTVVPGFNDAHDHLGSLFAVGQSSFFTPFSIPGLSKSEVIDSLVKLVKRSSPNQWIQGTIGLTVFNDTSIRRRLLDSLAPNNPVALQIMWGHGMILNCKALQEVGISDNAANPLSGWYERKAGTNFITGALYEGAQFPVWQALSLSDPKNTIKALRIHAREELAFGITTVQNMSSNFQGNAARQFFAEANLPVRTRIIAMPGSTERGRSLEELINTNTRLSQYTYTSGIKYVIDGTPLEQTALMTKPYPNRKDWYGTLNYPIDTIQQILREALRGGRQLSMHIVGDSATRVVLRLMKKMASNNEWKLKRVRIEHGDGLKNNDLIQDAKDMGIIIVQTPIHGIANPLNKWLLTGINMAVGSDATINPYLNILIMTTGRVDTRQNISINQAVIAYTKGSAYAEFAEKEKGTLAKGMLADLAVLSQDIFTIPAKQLPATKSIMTIINGKIAFEESEKL